MNTLVESLRALENGVKYSDDDLTVIVQDWDESDTGSDQFVAIQLARECLRLRAILESDRKEVAPVAWIQPKHLSWIGGKGRRPKDGVSVLLSAERTVARNFPLYTGQTSDARDAAVESFLSEVRAELLRARSKFPGERIMTIALAEEFGELAKAVLDEPAANVRKEAVQCAVMAARVTLDGDGSVREWRKEKGLDPIGSTPTHYVVWNGGAWMVKEADFFAEQGGLTENWGKTWRPVVADSISHARELAERTLEKAP